MNLKLIKYSEKKYEFEYDEKNDTFKCPKTKKILK